VALQAESWNPVLAWAKSTLGAEFKVAHGILHVAQDPSATAAIAAHVARLDDFELTVAHNLTTLTGSALLGLMLVAGAISAESGWKAAHVDEDFQISQWGEDFEAAKRRQNRRIDYDASLRFLNLLERDSKTP
jgi:chaperone required for assembly of F1-ATPase